MKKLSLRIKWEFFPVFLVHFDSDPEYDQSSVFVPGRRGVTLGKPDIKVETVNKETHSLEEETADVSTATRMVKAMYSVSRFPSESPGPQRGGVRVNGLKSADAPTQRATWQKRQTHTWIFTL